MGYDASGRLTSDGTRGVTSVSYDNNGMLTSEKSSGVQMTVTRDGLGRKTATTLNIYNSSGGVQSTETKSYTGNGHVVSKNAIVMSRFPGGFFDSAGNPYYYLTDFQGNNIGVYDKTGKLVQRTDTMHRESLGLSRSTATVHPATVIFSAGRREWREGH